MSVTVKIPAQLRAATGGEGELEVDGATVGEALDAVFAQHDGLRERITQDGDLRRFVNVYVSGEEIRSDGSPERDFLYVEDVARAYVAIADALADGRGRGEAFNAGWGKPNSVRE